MPLPLKHPLPPELDPVPPAAPAGHEPEPAGDGNEDPESELDTLTPDARRRIAER